MIHRATLVLLLCIVAYTSLVIAQGPTPAPGGEAPKAGAAEAEPKSGGAEKSEEGATGAAEAGTEASKPSSAQSLNVLSVGIGAVFYALSHYL